MTDGFVEYTTWSMIFLSRPSGHTIPSRSAFSLFGEVASLITGRVHSLESMGLVDGPGIRTVVFLQGCRLRCSFCHNPDTWQLSGGEVFSAEQLMAKIRRFKPYFLRSGGGVTFSGGEPLLQPAFLLEMLKLLKREGIHTCLDTAGVGEGDYTEILRHTDLILYDIKHIDPALYQSMTGQPICHTQSGRTALDSPCAGARPNGQPRAFEKAASVCQHLIPCGKGRAFALSSAGCS